VAAPPGRVAARAVQRIVDWVCNGSVEEVLVGKQLRLLADKFGRRNPGPN
jgi:BlaI family penicillinase repressor